MTNISEDLNAAVQRKVARKYRRLGYDVVVQPAPDRLPEFMQGVEPDIVARSQSDNVVIEVKRHSSLKGSNDMIGIAERVSSHPDWRFELVVIDNEENDRPAFVTTNYDSLLERVQIATEARLLDVAYVYLTHMLVAVAHDLSEKYGIKARNKTDRGVFEDLAFKGVLPDSLLKECLSVLLNRNTLVHTYDRSESLSEADLHNLLELCEQLKELA